MAIAIGASGVAYVGVFATEAQRSQSSEYFIIGNSLLCVLGVSAVRYPNSCSPQRHRDRRENSNFEILLRVLCASALKIVADQPQADPRLATQNPEDPHLSFLKNKTDGGGKVSVRV